jgi:hypothetical protein
MGEEKCCRLLVGTPEGKIPLGRPRRGLVDDIKMDPRDGEDEVVWTGLIWPR